MQCFDCTVNELGNPLLDPKNPASAVTYSDYYHELEKRKEEAI